MPTGLKIEHRRERSPFIQRGFTSSPSYKKKSLWAGARPTTFWESHKKQSHPSPPPPATIPTGQKQQNIYLEAGPSSSLGRQFGLACTNGVLMLSPRLILPPTPLPPSAAIAVDIRPLAPPKRRKGARSRSTSSWTRRCCCKVRGRTRTWAGGSDDGTDVTRTCTEKKEASSSGWSECPKITTMG